MKTTIDTTGSDFHGEEAAQLLGTIAAQRQTTIEMAGADDDDREALLARADELAVRAIDDVRDALHEAYNAAGPSAAKGAVTEFSKMIREKLDAISYAFQALREEFDVEDMRESSNIKERERALSFDDLDHAIIKAQKLVIETSPK